MWERWKLKFMCRDLLYRGEGYYFFDTGGELESKGINGYLYIKIREDDIEIYRFYYINR